MIRVSVAPAITIPITKGESISPKTDDKTKAVVIYLAISISLHTTNIINNMKNCSIIGKKCKYRETTRDVDVYKLSKMYEKLGKNHPIPYICTP